ncbi:MAG: Uma2 family endonuclease [Ignavibacteria bacterium]|nr:Uma2 family endonuclease [Ignavibacteria bacterium]
MSALKKEKYTEQEYLGVERQAEIKSEFYAGEMFAMAGASREHNIISLNIAMSFRRKTEKRACEVYHSDMRVYASKYGFYTYPDIVLVCGEPRFIDDMFDTLLNPSVLVEVLSKTTADYDKNQKFDFYRSIDSLKYYLVVRQNRPCVELRKKIRKDFWEVQFYENLGDIVRLDSLELSFVLAEIYEKIEFKEEDDERRTLQKT